VIGFVLGEARRYRPGSMKVLTSALRDLVRFLFVTAVVDQTGTSRLRFRASEPADEWAAEGGRCRHSRCAAGELRPVHGRRAARFRRVDVAHPTGAARASEVAALRLDDVDWRAGELVVRGKDNRVDRLPLPHDVGAALVDYLRHGRHQAANRTLFLRACAPDGAMTPRSVGAVPRSASMRAGLPVVGAHRLRNTVATEILRAGTSLPKIAQVLRHHDEASTVIYAAVDRAALEVVARPGRVRWSVEVVPHVN
jgi:integrase/recombinase XerD